MKGLREKFRNKKGFTLVEMLIVVAIIAILIAVSIPLVSTSLERARIATDQANERSAILLAEAKYLTDDNIVWSGTGNDKKAEFAYKIDGSSGSLETVPTDTKNDFEYGQCDKHDGGYIKVTLNGDGTVTCEWAGKTGIDKIPDFANPSSST